ADSKARSAATPSQLEAIKAGVRLIAELGGVTVIWDALRRAFEPFWYVQSRRPFLVGRLNRKPRAEDAQQMQPGNLQEAQDELMNIMTTMYIIIQEALSDSQELATVKEALRAYPPLVRGLPNTNKIVHSSTQPWAHWLSS